MIQKRYIAFALIGIIGGIWFTKAVYDYYNGPQTGNGVELTAYLGGTLEELGTPLKTGDSIDWGPLIIGQEYIYNLTVISHYTADYTICFLHPGLPDGWTQTWTCNNTVLAAGKMMSGDLSLTATTKGVETWGWNITVTIPP